MKLYRVDTNYFNINYISLPTGLDIFHSFVLKSADYLYALTLFLFLEQRIQPTKLFTLLLRPMKLYCFKLHSREMSTPYSMLLLSYP